MQLPPPLNTLDASHLSVAGIGLALGAWLKPQLTALARAFPDWLVRREKAKFEAAVAAGQIPPAAARLARALKRAVILWADQEMPTALGDDKMAKALAILEKLPYIGALVAADPQDVEDELQAEYDAMRAEVKKEAGDDKPTPVAKPNPAAENPVTTT